MRLRKLWKVEDNLAAGGNFINMFMRIFYALRSQKHKMAHDLTIIFELLGSTHVKAERKTLKKLTPGRRGDIACSRGEVLLAPCSQ